MPIQRSGLPLMILAGVAFVIAAVVVLLVANPFARTAREQTPVPAEPSATRPAEEPQSAERPSSERDDAEAAEPEPTEPDTEPAPITEPDPTPADSGARAEPQPAPARTQPDPLAVASDQESIPADTYVVRGGDTLFDVARGIWGDPWLWPLILDANEGMIRDPDYLRPGQQLRIPAWVTLESGLTTEQRRRLAEAHVIAYEHYRRLGSDAVGLGAGQPAWWLAQLGRIRLNKAHWVLYSGLRYDEELLARFDSEIRTEDAAQVQAFVDRFGLPPNRR